MAVFLFSECRRFLSEIEVDEREGNKESKTMYKLLIISILFY